MKNNRSNKQILGHKPPHDVSPGYTDTSWERNSFFTVVRNVELMRLQLIFNSKPDEAVRTILKGCGFKWAPRWRAWQRNLNSNGEYALNTVLEKLEKMRAKEGVFMK